MPEGLSPSPWPQGEVTSSCVSWEQSCGRQHPARAGQPSPGPWGCCTSYHRDLAHPLAPREDLRAFLLLAAQDWCPSAPALQQLSLWLCIGDVINTEGFMVIPAHIHKSLMLSWGKGALGKGDSPKGWIEGLNGLFCFSYE